MPIVRHSDKKYLWYEHICDAPRPDGACGYGHSISTIMLESVRGGVPGQQVWMAVNGEYGSQIVFCPFCGERLPNDLVGLEEK